MVRQSACDVTFFRAVCRPRRPALDRTQPIHPSGWPTADGPVL